MRVVAVAFEVESVVKSLERYAIKKNFHVMYTKIMQAISAARKLNPKVSFE